MNTADFDFHLPEEGLPKRPLKTRFSPNSSSSIVRRVNFRINTSTLLLICWNQVMLLSWTTPCSPARFYGQKEETGGHVELLLLKNTSGDEWRFCKLNAKVGTRVNFGDGLYAVVTEELTHGGRIVRFEYRGIFLEVFKFSGWNATTTLYPWKLDDRERYQTV